MRDFINQDAIPRQHLADHSQITHLRLNPLNGVGGACSAGHKLFGARWPLEHAVLYSRQQVARGRFGIAHNADIGFGTRDLGRIDVDADRLHNLRRPLPTRPLQLHARPNANHQISLCPTRRTGGNRKSKWMIVTNDAAPTAKRGHWRLQPFGQRLHLILGVNRPAANHDQWVMRRFDERSRLVDQYRVMRQHINLLRQQQLNRRRHAKHIPRHLQPDRARPSAIRLAEGLIDQRWRLTRVMDAGGPFHQRAHGGQLIGQLMQMPGTRSDIRRRHFARHADDGSAGAISGADRCQGVQQTRPRHHRKHTGFAAGLGIAVRHVSRSLFVPSRDKPNLVARLIQRIKQPICLHARNPKHSVHTVQHQRPHNRLTAS